MKTTLNIEESARLIELGVDPKLASMTIVTDEYNEQWENFQHPIFGLIDILSILPKEISINGKTENLNIVMDNWGSLVGYPLFHEKTWRCVCCTRTHRRAISALDLVPGTRICYP